MPLTDEQQVIVDHIIAKTSELTLIDSVAGSGKTTLLIAIAKAIQHTNGLYMAYNKSVATESKKKFPSTTHCMTTHSMAYQATVKPLKLKLGDFSTRTITEKIKYEDKYEIIQHIRAFCLSRFTSFNDYHETHKLPKPYLPIAQKYLTAMHNGTIDCTHEFYLKLFHIMLHNDELEYEPFDFIMLDEAGDLNEVTLEIFRLLPSICKIAVGDPFQNIYAFNHTINCFEALKDEGTLFRMSRSFRVADTIAPKIEHFCKTYLNAEMKFRGVPVTNQTIHTRAYLTRTNGALIAKMVELNKSNIPYGLVRKASEIFKVPLMLCSIKYQGFISDPSYKHLQPDIDDWYENLQLQEVYKTPLSYIGHLHKDDISLQQAIRLIIKYGRSVIMDTYVEAKKHESNKQVYTLATVHSCKGSEFDEVTIASDLNESVSELIEQINLGRNISTLLPSERESFNLYYVACTRAAKMLNNAVYL